MQILVLSFNAIQRLEGLSELTGLKRLDLAHNLIKKVGARGLGTQAAAWLALRRLPYTVATVRPLHSMPNCPYTVLTQMFHVLWLLCDPTVQSITSKLHHFDRAAPHIQTISS